MIDMLSIQTSSQECLVKWGLEYADFLSPPHKKTKNKNKTKTKIKQKQNKTEAFYKWHLTPSESEAPVLELCKVNGHSFMAFTPEWTLIQW